MKNEMICKKKESCRVSAHKANVRSAGCCTRVDAQPFIPRRQIRLCTSIYLRNGLLEKDKF